MLNSKTKKTNKLTPRPWAHDWNNPVEREEKKKT
jgi:hypothetical protein